MKQFTITISDEEEKALLVDMISIQDWLDNAIHEKARRCIDLIVKQYSDKQPEKIPLEEKLRIVREAEVKSAAEEEADRREAEGK